MKKTKHVHTKYTLHDQPLAIVLSNRYLGVYINSKLSWNDHIDTTAKKATQSFSFLRGNFSCSLTPIREQCYKTLVRPQLECASCVWDNLVKCNVGKSKPSSQARHGSPILTSNVNQVSHPCYRNSSGTHFNNVELVAESLCCITFAMVWWPFLLQLTSIRLQPTPEHPKPDTDRSSAIQTHTAIPSFLLQFANGILYRSTFADCHQTASKLN